MYSISLNLKRQTNPISAGPNNFEVFVTDNCKQNPLLILDSTFLSKNIIFPLPIHIIQSFIQHHSLLLKNIMKKLLVRTYNGKCNVSYMYNKFHILHHMFHHYFLPLLHNLLHYKDNLILVSVKKMD